LYQHRLWDISYKYGGSAFSLDITPDKLNVAKVLKWAREFVLKTDTAMMTPATTMVDNSNERQVLAGVKYDLNNLRTMQLDC